jgi:taurine transport system substrate-binding protein
VTGDAYAAYRKNPASWDAHSPEVGKISHITGEKPEDIPESLLGSVFPLLSEQLSENLLGGGSVKAIAAASQFLKEQGKIPAVLADYSVYVEPKFVKSALATN